MAAASRSPASTNTSEMLRSAPGTARIRRRCSRASASRASRRARPTWPADTDAAHCAISWSMPSRRTRTSAIDAADGVRRASTRHRERMVTDTSSGWVDGAQSRKTVCGPGSSTAFSSAFEAPSVSRSASSMSTIWKRPVAGRRAANWTTARISFTEMVRPSGVTVRTSACVAAITVRQCEHWPHPPYSHCSAAAKARAATERPEPGGPVNSQAWVIAAVGTPGSPRAAATAAVSSSMACCWPMTSSKTAAAGWPISVTMLTDPAREWPGRRRPGNRCGRRSPAAADW